MSVVKINAIRVPEGAGPELEKRFAARAGTVEGSPGFLGFQLLRPTAGEDRYFVVTHWADEESFIAWRDGDARAAHAGERAAEAGGAASAGGAAAAGGAASAGGAAAAGGGAASGSRPVATGADLLEFEVVLDVAPQPADPS